MPGVVGAFVGGEEVERSRDEAADLVEGAWTRGAQERFQFGERELDRIEIRTVGREKPNVRARVLDGGPDPRLLVDYEVVEHDDIAGSQAGHQHLFDVGEEARTVDRPIEDGRRADPLETERGNHGVRLPVTAGGVIMQPYAARDAAVAT